MLSDDLLTWFGNMLNPKKNLYHLWHGCLRGFFWEPQNPKQTTWFCGFYNPHLFD